MKKNIFCLIVLVCTVSLFAEGISTKSPIGSFKLDVNTNVEQKYLVKLNKFDQKRALKLVNEIYEMLAILPEEIQTEQIGNGNIESESFDDDKLAIVQIAVRSHHFTINQLIHLLGLFTFEDDKISIVQIVYPKVIDKENAFNLLNSFTYSSDKQRVQQIIQ